MQSGLSRLVVLTALLGAALVALPVAAQLAPGDYSFTVSHDGRLRGYELHVPPGYRRTAPLVLDFHGFSSNASQQAFLSGFRPKSDQEGFLVAWPEGFGGLRSWNAESCCGDAARLGLDDVRLAVAIVADISARTPVDAKRVYATGLSNGGALSHLLACRAADVFAAVAPVSYPLPTYTVASCQPSRPVPVMHFHGFADLIVPYWTGLFPIFRSAPESFGDWDDIHSCTDWASISYWKWWSYCRTYDRCDGDAEVTLCSIQGGHILYVNANGVDIPDLAWDFFTRHALP